MKYLNITTIILLSFLLWSVNTYSQEDTLCGEFAKSKGLSLLNTDIYTHDGQFIAKRLSGGEELTVTRPFYKGQSYRIVVVGSDNFPTLHFQILNFEMSEVIHDNQNKSKIWDFQAGSSEIYHIVIKVPGVVGSQKGCVAVIIGTKK